jgi:hypothetical protein
MCAAHLVLSGWSWITTAAMHSRTAIIVWLHRLASASVESPLAQFSPTKCFFDLLRAVRVPISNEAVGVYTLMTVYPIYVLWTREKRFRTRPTLISRSVGRLSRNARIPLSNLGFCFPYTVKVNRCPESATDPRSRRVLMFDTGQSCDIMGRGNRGLSLLAHRTEQSHEATPTRCSYTRGDYPTLS